MTDRDIVALLTAEHEDFRHLFDELSDAAPERSVELFGSLVARMASHEAAEQALVHRTVYEEIPAGHRVADAVLAEEEEIERSVAEMDGLDPLSEAFRDALERLREDVLAHAEHEEQVEFPLLRRHVAEERRQQLGEQFLRLQQQRSSRRHAVAQPTTSAAGTGSSATIGAFERARDSARKTFSD